MLQTGLLRHESNVPRPHTAAEHGAAPGWGAGEAWASVNNPCVDSIRLLAACYSLDFVHHLILGKFPRVSPNPEDLRMRLCLEVGSLQR